MLSKWLTEILVLLAVGLGVACVCIWLHEHGICPLKAIKKVMRKMSFIGICVLALWAVPLIQYGSTKDGGTNNMQNVANMEMLPMTSSNTQLGNGNIGTGNNIAMATLITSTNTTRTITGDDFRRGFVMSRVGTDEAFDFAAPSNAVVCSDWRAFGAATDWIYVALTNWAFQVATNDVDRLRIYSFGKIEPQIMEAGGEIATNYWFAPFMASLGIARQANWDWLAESDRPSQLWHYVTPSNTLQITWQNALLGRDTDTPLSFLIEFRTDGQFTYRYDLSRCGALGDRALPEGWDGVITNGVIGASFAGNDWTTNAIPTNVTSMTFYPLSVEDAVNPDPDNDGLATIDELFVYHTDPRHPDSDYDGLTDYEELFVYHTDPLDPYSAGGPHCDGVTVRLGSLDPFSYPEGSTNTVLEHIFYSGTTNGAFAYPQSDTDTAILKVMVSGTGTGRLIVGDSVVPLVAPPQMRSGTATNILQLAVGRGVRKDVWFDKPDGLDVAKKSNDFFIGEMPSPLWPHGWLAFPHVEATVPCIHDFNTRTKFVTLVHGEEFPGMTATWNSGGSDGVVVSNIPPVSAGIGGNFPKNSARAISYTLDHPHRLNDHQITIGQELRFCPAFTPEYETNTVGVAALGDTDSPDKWGDEDYPPQPLDDDDTDEEVAFTNIVSGALIPLYDVLYLYRDNTRTEYLEVPNGPARECCPCPEHKNTNYVAKVSYTGNVDVRDAAGNIFETAYSPCTVTLSGTYPSREFYDSPVHFVTNGAPYKEHRYTVLGVGFESGDNRPAISNYNQRSSSLGYPIVVGTNRVVNTQICLLTDVLLSNGVVRVALEGIGAGKFQVWLPEWIDHYSYSLHPAELLLDSETRTNRCFSIRQWRNIMRRYGENLRSLYVDVVSSEAGRRDFVLEFAASDGTAFVHDFARQRMTSVNPLLLPDYDRDGRIDGSDIQMYIAGRMYRYWINECKVSGSVWEEPSLFEGVADALVGLENWRNDHVDGAYDLINLFPIAIEFGPFLQAWGSGVSFKVTSESGADVFNYTLANINHLQAGTIRTAPHVDVNNHALTNASLTSIGGAGITFSRSQALSYDDDSCLLIAEAKAYSWVGMKMTVSVDGKDMFDCELPITTSSVDEMFRFVSIRGSHDNPTSNFGNIAQPYNNPDSELALKDVFFVHGFNVDFDGARNWNREMFKRFWVSGMNARYWGVTWSGDYHVAWPDFVGEDFNGLHYHRDVRQAMMTAPTFARLVNSNSTDAVVIGHSLGNMVVSEALLKGANAHTYIMLDAAVASEAYRPELQADSDAIRAKYRPGDWNGYDSLSWAANWYTWFTNDVNDARGTIGWAGHFAPLLNRQGLDVFNFYSSGDEVFAENSSTPGLTTGVFDWPTLNLTWPFIHLNLTLDAFPWQKQEVFKGVNAAGSLSAGWGFHCWPTNINDETVWVKYSATDANAMVADGSIVTNAVFDRGVSAMFNSTISDYDIADILAFHIPAISSPAGKVEVIGSHQNIANDFNLNDNTYRANDWGRSKPSGYPENELMPWLHSDIKNMAYYYVYPAFTSIVEKGKMK